MTVLAAALAGLALGALGAGLWARRESRRAEREAEEARRRVEEARRDRQAFFDQTTHELRSPLAAILGYQELLSDGAYGELDEEVRDALARIGRAAGHLLNLIEGVMELSREGPGDDVAMDTVELDGLVADTARSLRDHAADRGIRAAVTVGPLPSIRTDRNRLARLLDLVTTAAARRPARDTLAMDVASAGGQLVMRLGPTGIPASPAPDTPAEPSLRLVLAHRLARQIGGTLTAEPVADGTDLVLQVPASAPEPGL